MNRSDFIDAHGTTWRIYDGLPPDYPETGDVTPRGTPAGLTFRASSGEVRVLPRAAIPRRRSMPRMPAPLGTKQPADQPATPSWEELLHLALPWPPV